MKYSTCGRGYFNIIHSRTEKNNSRYNDRWSSLFNVVINSLNLRELELSRRQFTWANRFQIPTYEKLDRILVSTEWEVKHPQVTVRAFPREISDTNIKSLCSVSCKVLFHSGCHNRHNLYDTKNKSFLCRLL
jgi:hypothetical protein